MKFGTKLRLIKDWKLSDDVTLETGDLLEVALYDHKYGMKLHYHRLRELIDFKYGPYNSKKRIDEYFEIVEDSELIEDIDYLILNQKHDDVADFIKHIKYGVKGIKKIIYSKYPKALS